MAEAHRWREERKREHIAVLAHWFLMGLTKNPPSPAELLGRDDDGIVLDADNPADVAQFESAIFGEGQDPKAQRRAFFEKLRGDIAHRGEVGH